MTSKSYALGVSMGIAITLLFVAIFGLQSDKSYEKQIAKLTKENKQLSAQIKSQDQTKIKEQPKENTEKQEDKKVKINIKSSMTHKEIADLLIKNKIYPYENDLLMIMELIDTKIENIAIVLESSGQMKEGYDFAKTAKNLMTRSSDISESLLRNHMIQDKNSFMKILYLADTKHLIRPGVKEFKQNSSLREVADKLIE